MISDKACGFKYLLTDSVMYRTFFNVCSFTILFLFIYGILNNFTFHSGLISYDSFERVFTLFLVFITFAIFFVEDFTFFIFLRCWNGRNQTIAKEKD